MTRNRDRAAFLPAPFRRILAAVAVLCMGLAGGAAQAQSDPVYIQLEARQTLQAAQDSARAFSRRFDTVAGFALPSGWYGIALGPYSRAEAEGILPRLRAAGIVPSDSYIQDPTRYGAQFWPVGAQSAPQVPQTPPALQQAQTADQSPDRVILPDETPSEARASEATLGPEARRALQTALAWAGYYTAGIDGAFGRGTRAAMSAWQADQGYEPTGVLTTRQRAALLAQYNAVFDGLGFAVLDDRALGISIQMPLGVVARDRVEPPFAVFTPAGDLSAQVLLISQPGDRRTLRGLYEIMQTLEIVPLTGPRSISGDSFTLTGSNSAIVSHTEARLEDGAIKGFTLIWPAGDEARRTRVLDRMADSFVRLDGVLDPGAGAQADDAVDLVSGLAIRQPTATASGFFVNDRGALVTSADTVAGCTRITVNDAYTADMVAADDRLGLAILEPRERLAPRATAAFGATPPRLRSEVAVAGYPFGGGLRAPTLTYGTVEDLQGLQGEPGLTRLAMTAMPGDTGGPVLDAAGRVVGMLLPDGAGTGRVLPQDVRFAAGDRPLIDFLTASGITVNQAQSAPRLDPLDLSRRAADMTALIGCWD